MERVLVIGSGGAGKTTFSLALASRTGLPVVHLDAHFWRPGWVQPSSEEWAEQVDRLTAAPRWIMDGNYGGTMDSRLTACDTVVFLDRPRLLCVCESSSDACSTMRLRGRIWHPSALSS